MYNPIEIQNYELIFEPFLFQLKVTGQFEIKSQYQIPTQTLFSKITLPNQEVSEIELIPDKKSKCRSNSWSCQVFRISTFLKLSGDKYFSREITSKEKIPFHISFEVSTNNQQYFLNINSIKDPFDKHYIDFLTHIKLLEIQDSFMFQNTFLIERKKYERVDYILGIPSKWRIYKKGHQYSYEQLFLSLQKYDEVPRNSIRDWFFLRNTENLEVISSEFSIMDSNNRETIQESLRTRYANKRLFFFRAIDNHEINKGFLQSKLLLKLRNNSFVLKIKNSFSFRNLNSSLRKIKIVQKRDLWFKNLDFYRWIEI